jgi:hypothetical protein
LPISCLEEQASSGVPEYETKSMQRVTTQGGRSKPVSEEGCLRGVRLTVEGGWADGASLARRIDMPLRMRAEIANGS